MGNYLALALAVVVLGTMSGQAAVIVQLRVVDGEGAVHATASRATRGITVQVTDESGKPVEGATVSFRLPDQGPSGTFTGGLKSEVALTHADGKATVWGMQWNKLPGPFEVRITAVKDQARAGLVSAQYLSETAAVDKSGGSGVFQPSHASRGKWLIVAGAVAAGAAGAGVGLVFGRSHPAPAATVLSTIPISIGAPSINIEGPK